MSEKKKVSEMTFAEFTGEADKRGATEIKHEILNALIKEGFSEQEINEMKMQKVWDIYLTALSHEFEEVFSVFGKYVESGKELPKPVQAILEQLRKELEKIIAEYE